VGTQSQLRVSWTAPDNNGDAVSSYTLTTLRGGSAVSTQKVSSTSQNVTVDNSEADYTFTVSATNKAGTSGTSARSSAIRAAGKPGRVSGGTVKETGTSGQLKATFSPLTQAQRNGSQASEIQYSYRASTSGGVVKTGGIAAGGGTIGGLPNGQNVTINIIATSTKNNVSGDAAAIGTANPYGPPGAPNVTGRKSAQGDGDVHWNWTKPATNGRALNHYEVSLDNGSWRNVGTATSFSASGGGWNKGHTLRVKAYTVVFGPAGSANSTSGDSPAPTSWDIRATPVRTCTEPNSGTNSYRNTNPDQCISPGKWFDTGITAQTDYYVRWGSSGRLWYHLTSGPAAGNFARGDTTSLGASPPAGMPQR